jgi:hypothetical protein
MVLDAGYGVFDNESLNRQAWFYTSVRRCMIRKHLHHASIADPGQGSTDERQEGEEEKEYVQFLADRW